ncbi:MAG: septum formation initiator family protein [Acidobacteriota bacterium]
MSQAANTILINRVNSQSKAGALVNVPYHRLIDALVLMILLAAVAICSSVYLRGRAELNAAITKHEATSRKVEGLSIEIERLRRDIDRLKHDPRMIETIARQKLGLIGQGDVVIKIKPDQSD